jgi:hypothetical protein
VRMANGNGFSFFLRATKSQLELLAHRGNFRDIVEERDAPKAGADSQSLRGVVSDGSGGGAAVHVEEIPFLKDGHQLFHERGIGGGF